MVYKEQLQHLDVLKGSIIFLVVVGHAFHFGFDYYRSTLLYILRSIDMPIFLFLSGLLGAGAIKFERASVINYWLKKGRQLLLPLTTLPFLYALFFGIEFEHLVFDRMHGGYWFTLVLFEMFLLLFIVRWINSLVNKSENPAIEVGLTLASLAFVLLIDEPWQRVHPITWEALSWGKTNYLYYYFLFGYFVGRYHKLQELISSLPLQTASFFIFLLGMYWTVTRRELFDGILTSFSGLILAYGTAKRVGDSPSRMNRLLSYLGKESRTIYLTHYFFLFSAPMVGKYLLSLKNLERIFMWELLASGMYALIVIAVTLLAVKLITGNPVLSLLFYGRKSREVGGREAIA